MNFESAYDLELEVGKEVVFVRRDDRHRKVRVYLTKLELDDGIARFTAHSRGTSVKEIKASKKDETPVVVNGEFEHIDDVWVGELTPA